MIFSGIRARKTSVNFSFLSSALNQMGPWRGKSIEADLDWVLAELGRKIDLLDWKAVAEDVRRFVRPKEQPSLDLWCKELFMGQLEKIKGG